MITRRTALAFTVTATTLAAAGLSLHAGLLSPAASPRVAQLGDAQVVSGSPYPSRAQTSLSPLPATTPGGAERLDAVRTVKLFCDLVERGRLWRAGGLCSAPAVWRRRELRTLDRYTFLSARIVAASDPRALSMLVRVRVRAGRRAALDGATLHDGINTLQFTLGRVGTTAGGWLISAITTSP